MKNQQKKVVLPPPVFTADPVGAEFCKWFWTSSSGWDWLSGTPPAPGVKTKWETENKFPIQPLELWHRFNDPHEAIGVRFKELADYLIIDIDRHSPNHPANNPGLYMGLIYALREIGLIGYCARWALHQWQEQQEQSRHPETGCADNPLRNFLDTLGLVPPFTLVELKTAYRRLSLISHPDVGGSEQAFLRGSPAYEAFKPYAAGGSANG